MDPKQDDYRSAGAGLDPLGFPTDISDLRTIDPDNRRAYIHSVLAIADNDARNYTLTATVEVGIIVFFAKDSVEAIRAASIWLRIPTAIAVLLLASSAACYFFYALTINARRMAIARTLAQNDAEHARNLWYTKDKKKGVYKFGRKYLIVRMAGMIALAVGAAIATSTVIALLVSGGATQ